MEGSPTPKSKMDFYKALQELTAGKKITRIDWNTENVYGILMDDIVKIHRDDKFSDWIICEGDLRATDWIIIN